MIMKQFVTALVLGLAVVGFARADDKKDAGDDAKFIQEAASGGMLEVKLGELAKERAASSEVRKFAERMVTDHSKANKELTSVADKIGVKVSKDLSKKDQEVYDKLKELKGADFDKAYINHMVKDHEMDVEHFTKCSKDAK